MTTARESPSHLPEKVNRNQITAGLSQSDVPYQPLSSFKYTRVKNMRHLLLKLQNHILIPWSVDHTPERMRVMLWLQAMQSKRKACLKRHAHARDFHAVCFSI
jgi:hypothetical protein